VPARPVDRAFASITHVPRGMSALGVTPVQTGIQRAATKWVCLGRKGNRLRGKRHGILHRKTY
jgi:hypothetical protein